MPLPPYQGSCRFNRERRETPFTTQLSCFLLAVLFSAALFLPLCFADAMEIQQFDGLSLPDQGRYVATLFEKSALSFLDRGNVAEAKKIRLLFTRDSKDTLSKGMGQLSSYINQVREVNPSVDVEKIMVLVFKKNDINVPLEQMMQFGKDFKPSDIEEVATPGLSQ